MIPFYQVTHIVFNLFDLQMRIIELVKFGGSRIVEYTPSLIPQCNRFWQKLNTCIIETPHHLGMLKLISDKQHTIGLRLQCAI